MLILQFVHRLKLFDDCFVPIKRKTSWMLTAVNRSRGKRKRKKMISLELVSLQSISLSQNSFISFHYTYILLRSVAKGNSGNSPIFLIHFRSLRFFFFVFFSVPPTFSFFFWFSVCFFLFILYFFYKTLFSFRPVCAMA